MSVVGKLAELTLEIKKLLVQFRDNRELWPENGKGGEGTMKEVYESPTVTAWEFDEVRMSDSTGFGGIDNGGEDEFGTVD